MKNERFIDKQRLDFAIRYYKGDIPEDKEIMDYIASEDNDFIIMDNVKIINQTIIKLGYRYIRDKVDTVGYGEVYPNDLVTMILADFTAYEIKVIKENLSYA